jgi:hypothetical protein
VYVLYAKASQPYYGDDDWFVQIAGWDPTRAGDNLDRRQPFVVALVTFAGLTTITCPSSWSRQTRAGARSARRNRSSSTGCPVRQVPRLGASPPKICEVKARVVAGAAVLGAALLGAAWLVTYQRWYPYNFIDYPGGRLLWTEPVKHYPWWGPYAAVGLVLMGAVVADRLVPEVRLVIRREARRLGHAAVVQLQALVRRAIVR